MLPILGLGGIIIHIGDGMTLFGVGFGEIK
jgi:hypothetical protein